MYNVLECAPVRVLFLLKRCLYFFMQALELCSMFLPIYCKLGAVQQLMRCCNTVGGQEVSMD